MAEFNKGRSSGSPSSSTSSTSQPPALNITGRNEESPSEKTEQQAICSVCFEVSPNHHSHYGALCCLSCRAFFRRANQNADRKVNYVCKFENLCHIKAGGRKKCQKCRYDRCLEVGMDESMVLSEGQKKVRFRKSLEKKSSTSMMAVSASPFQQVDDSVDDISRNHTTNAQPTKHLYRQLGKYIRM